MPGRRIPVRTVAAVIAALTVVGGGGCRSVRPTALPERAAERGGQDTAGGNETLAPVATKEAARFRWPVDAPRVTSGFGKRWGRLHEGIDLTVPVGTAVYAADGGEVVYAGGAVRGYGNMVVVKHMGDLMTVYAHNSVLMVKVGQHVSAGQRVALSGQSGRVTGPHVHFEIRRSQIPRDPLPYLPKLPSSPNVGSMGIARDRIPKS